MKLNHIAAAIMLGALALPVPASALLLPAVQKIREASRLRPLTIYTVDLDTPVTLMPGDEFDLTLTFAGDTTLNVANFRGGGVRVAAGDVTGVVTLESSNTIAFLGSSGLRPDPAGPFITIEPGAVGASFTAADVVSGLGPVSFSGLRLRSGVIAEVGAGRPATVGRVSFWFGGTNVGYVPEPAAWTLLILGFGLSGVVLRRRPDRQVKTD